MSGRRARGESLWDRKETQTEMSEKIRRQGKEPGDSSPIGSNIQTDDDKRRDRQPDERENQYGSLPSDDSYSGDNRSPKQSRTSNDERRDFAAAGKSRIPCKFFSLGKCNRNNCKFSHEQPSIRGPSQEAPFFQFQRQGDEFIASSGQDMFLQQTQIQPQDLNLANALDLLYALPISAQQTLESHSLERENLTVSNSKQEPVGGKSEAQGKVEECNDEKAMRQFKVALVEFVKDILKPTWKEGKMSRQVYKTIVKKVVDKVTSSIQGTQIPRTQEKTDQYLAFSKPKITKLVEAYVARFVKA